MLMNISSIINVLIDPLFYLIFILLLIAFRMLRKKNPLRPFISFVFILLLFSSPMPVWLMKWWEGQYIPVTKLEKKDAAVILGGGILNYYTLDHQHLYSGTVGRILETLKLYRQGWVKKIIVSGGDPGGIPKGALGEAASMVMFLKQVGVPASDILIEDKSLNTYEEAVYLKKLFPKWGIKSFYLVTNAYHMKRSMDSFLKQDLKGVPFPVTFNKSEGGLHLYHMGVFKSLMHEWLGLVVYKLRGRV